MREISQGNHPAIRQQNVAFSQAVQEEFETERIQHLETKWLETGVSNHSTMGFDIWWNNENVVGSIYEKAGDITQL